MYCPVCGQQQISDLTRFCSKCGFSLTGIAEVVANNGIIPYASPIANRKLTSPRKRGLKQGLFILLFGVFLLVPIVGFISMALNIEPILMAIITVLSFFGGILRMIYALMFEDGREATTPDKLLPDAADNLISSFKKSNKQKALPPQSAKFETGHSTYVPPAVEFQKRSDWREANTGELVQPNSVTEGPTKLLEKNK